VPQCGNRLEHEDRTQIDLSRATRRRRFVRIGVSIIDLGDQPIPRATAMRTDEND
jgi:hypothetical protein